MNEKERIFIALDVSIANLAGFILKLDAISI